MAALVRPRVSEEHTHKLRGRIGKIFPKSTTPRAIERTQDVGSDQNHVVDDASPKHPFLQVENVDEALQHLENDLIGQSQKAFEEARDAGKLARIRKIFGSTYATFETISGLSDLGVDIVSLAVPMAAPAKVIIGAFTWLFKSFKGVSDYFDRIIQFYQRMNDVFDQIRAIAEEVLKARDKYALVLECVTDIYSLVLKICNDTSEEPKRRFKTWVKITFRGEGEEDFEDIDKACKKLESAKLTSVFNNTSVMTGDVQQMKNQILTFRRGQERMLQMQQEMDPQEMKVMLREIWSHFASPSVNGNEGNAMAPTKASKSLSTKQGAELLELQQRLCPPDQSVFLQDVEETYFDLDTESSNSWFNGESTTVSWIIGPPGIGKTYHAFSIFDRYKKNGPNNAAVFFFKGRQTSCSLRDALSSMIHQLAVSNSGFCKKMLVELQKLWREHGEKYRPDEKYLWNLLSTSIIKEDSHSNNQKTGILLFFDGMDEASDEDRTALMELTGSLPKSNEKLEKSSLVPIRVILTSRKMLDEEKTRLEAKVVQLCPNYMRSSFKNYCKSKVEIMSRLRKFNARTKGRIVSEIAQKADGMLYIENMLFKLDSKGFQSTVSKELKSMPDGLEALYKSMLNDSLIGLSEEQMHTFHALFTWLAYSFQPLSIQQSREITQLSISNKASFAFEDEIFRRFSGFLEVTRDSLVLDDGLSIEAEDEQITAYYDNLPLQFQSECSRDFFRGWDSEQPDIRSNTFKSHLLILDMSTHLLCSLEASMMLEAYAARYWFDHFLDMDAAHRDGESLSEEDIYRVMVNLATVMRNTGNFSKKFERHSREVYSQIRGGQGSRIPDIVAKWVSIAKTTSIQDRLRRFKDSKMPTGYSRYIPLEPYDELKIANWVLELLETMSMDVASRAIASFSQSHGSNWLLQYTPSAAAETYKFALDALRLKDKLSFRGDPASSIQDVAKLLGLDKTPGRFEMAVGLVQESFKLYDEALSQFQISLDRLHEDPNSSWLDMRLNQFSCMMSLSRCHAWQRNYDMGISNAEEALLVAYQVANYTDSFVDGIDQVNNRFDTPLGDIRPVWNQFRREALIQCAQCHSSRNSDEDRELIIPLISYARNIKCDIPMDGFVLNHLMEALASEKGNEKERLFNEFKSWSGEDQDSWLQWTFKTNDDVAYRRLRAAAGSGENTKLLLKSLERAMRPLQGTPAWIWAQFRVAMLHRSASEDHQTAKEILGTLIGGKYKHQSNEILLNARYVLSDILYDEFRKLPPKATELRTKAIQEVEGLPKVDETYSNHDLRNSVSFITLARMYRICGDLERYESFLTKTFQACISALRDSSGGNDLTSFRILAKVLSGFGSLEEDARIAISLQFSHVDPDVPDKFSRETTIFEEVLTEDLYNFASVYCSCGKVFQNWGYTDGITPLYACLICADNDLCQDCFDIRRRSDKDSRFNEWQYYCPRDHKYLKAPINGWQGVRDGLIRVASWEKPKNFKQWLEDLEIKWENAWKNFCWDEAFIRDIL